MYVATEGSLELVKQATLRDYYVRDSSCG